MLLNWGVEKTLESPLDCKELQPVHPKGNQSWIFIGRTEAEAEIPILWPPDAKNWLFRKDPDAGKDWRQEEKGTTEDEMDGITDAMDISLSSVQFSSVQSLSHVQLCYPMNCSTPGLLVHHQLPEFTQTHVHWIGDAIQPSHPLSSLSPPALNLSQHQGLFWFPLGWVWVGSRNWWWTGKPDMLQSLGSQSQTWLSNWTELKHGVGSYHEI